MPQNEMVSSCDRKEAEVCIGGFEGSIGVAVYTADAMGIQREHADIHEGTLPATGCACDQIDLAYQAIHLPQNRCKLQRMRIRCSRKQAQKQIPANTPDFHVLDQLGWMENKYSRGIAFKEEEG